MNGLAVAQESVRAIVMMRMLHAAMACKQNRGHAGRSSEAKSEHSSIALSPGSEVPMKFGPSLARDGAREEARVGTGDVSRGNPEKNLLNTSLWQRMLSVFMAIVLATSMTPSRALASDEDATNSVAAESAEGVAASGVDSQSGEAVPGEDVSDTVEDVDTDSVIDESVNANKTDGGLSQAMAEPGQSSLAGAVSSSNDGVSAFETDAAAGGAQQNDSLTRAVASLDSSSVISVGSSKNAVSFTNYSGYVKTTTTLYATAWTKRGASKIPSSGFTYQWYASDATNASAKDMSQFEPIAGQTSSSIVLDDTLRTQLDGKCLRVAITSGDTTVYGPSLNKYRATLSAVKRIDAPVKAKTALDEKSYILIQPSDAVTSSTNIVKPEILRPGSVLCANAYDSEAVPSARISAQNTWTYQWLAGDSRDADDSAYLPIEGQTSQTLTITEDLAKQLAGKYIRVKVTGDGQELYGPSGSFDRPASVKYNTPGPVASVDQLAVNHIVLAYNGEKFGNQVEDIPNANVGDTICAAAYYLNYDTPTDLYGEDKVDFSWQVADDKDGEYREVATGATFTVGDYAGKYLKVVATAKNGIAGIDSHETEPGRILAKGASTLYYVDYANASKGAKDTGSTIEAVAYKGDYWENETVTEGVTFTWRWSEVDPDSADFDEGDWHVVDGQSSASFTIPDDYAFRWVNVTAYAGDNTVVADSSVKVKPAGSHELSSLVYVKKIAGDLDAKYQYKTGEKIGVEAFELTSAGTKGSKLSNDQLSFTWQIADSRNGEYVDLNDANLHRSSFVIPESYEGKFLKCLVSAGYNTEVALLNKAIVKGDGAATYGITSVDVEQSNNLVQVGSTLTPTANYLATNEHGEYETSLPSGSVVTYAWFAADDENRTNAVELTGADDATGALKIPASAEGKYIYVVANAGENDKESDPLFVGAAEEKTIKVNVKITGVTDHNSGESYSFESWIPLTEYAWSSDEKKSAWDIFKTVLDSAGYTYNDQWGTPYSITTPDKKRTLAMSSSAPWSYWSFFVNGTYAPVMATGYLPVEGDTIELTYIDASGTFVPGGEPETNLGTPHPDIDVTWNGFANGSAGSATDALTPTTKTDTPSWALNLLTEEQQKAGASASASDPIVANGKVYLVTGASVWGGKTWNAVLNEIDSETGSVVRSLELGSSMDTTCRPVIAQGIILIPLSGGYLQAVSAKTFETLWYSDAFTNQNLSSLTVDGDYVYINTLDDDQPGKDVQNGTVKRINIHTGAVAGSASVTDGGFYWSGGLMVNGYYVVGGDYGQVRVYSADLSKLVGSIKLSGGNIRSALVLHDGFVYAVTRDDGTLHKLTIGSDGSITEDSAVQFAPYSTSTPVFSGKYAFICGATANNWTAKGLLSIIDLSDMSVKQITKANGEELGFESKSTPLVSTHDGETYVYFTLNGAKGNWPNYTSGGGVYMYKLGDAEATEVFVPGSGYANYCMASVVCDEFGNLYYTNDSGHLFCVKSQAHRVKFDTQGGSSINDQTPASGSAVAKPADPTREGYTFAGWYTDAACTKAYDFATAVTSDLTLYAKWTKNEASSPDTDNAGGKKDNAGTQSASQGGYVSPSSLPLSQSALSKNDGEKADDGKKADGQKSAKASDAKSSSKAENDTATKSAAAADDGASSTESAPIWPYIVLAVGVAGLAAATVWFVVARRKRDGDE